MYQKCPICNGTGNEPVIMSGDAFPTCRTCKGAKIINEETGFPPEGV